MQLTAVLVSTLAALPLAAATPAASSSFKLAVAPQAAMGNQVSQIKPVELIVFEGGRGGPGGINLRPYTEAPRDGSKFRLSNGNLITTFPDPRPGHPPLKESLQTVQKGQYLTFNEVPPKPKRLGFANGDPHLRYAGDDSVWRLCGGVVSLGVVKGADCEPVFIFKY